MNKRKKAKPATIGGKDKGIYKAYSGPSLMFFLLIFSEIGTANESDTIKLNTAM